MEEVREDFLMEHAYGILIPLPERRNINVRLDDSRILSDTLMLRSYSGKVDIIRYLQELQKIVNDALVKATNG